VPFSPSLIAAVSIQLGCQLFKVFYYSAKDRRFSIRWFFSAGGMPSAHTAFVSALAVSVGLHRGLSSEIFAVAFVFAVIVVYDILRVRAAVQAHSNILRQLLAERAARAEAGIEEPTALPSEVGHTVAEVAIGFAVGAGGAVALFLLMELF
jgi:acid phosphatase family membrane protein YuiD